VPAAASSRGRQSQLPAIASTDMITFGFWTQAGLPGAEQPALLFFGARYAAAFAARRLLRHSRKATTSAASTNIDSGDGFGKK
jgi:hypothetical protein